MAIKGKETVRSGQMGLLSMVLVFAVVVGYTFVYNRIISGMDDYVLKTAIGVAALAVMILGFLVVVRYLNTSFNMVLTHSELRIERKALFWHKIVADIPAVSFVDIVDEKDFKRGGKKVQNFTLGQIDNMAKHVLLYRDGDSISCAKVQCSAKFYRALEQMIKKPKK